ncbi:recombinase family protein, partial [Thermodesulfobacteriota bacterium]
RFGVDGRFLDKPRIGAGKYWGRKVQEGRMKHFLKGYYVQPMPPYGMKRVRKKSSDEKFSRYRSRYILIPGDSEEVQIVRLIFDLFVNHYYNRTDISNLLNAQGAKPPGRKTIWKSNAVSAILKDPVYIGANQHQETIRYNVFPSVLDKFLFFEAQAKIMRERFPREVHKSIYYDCPTLKYS